jgi:hypothetical protein
MVARVRRDVLSRGYIGAMATYSDRPDRPGSMAGGADLNLPWVVGGGNNLTVTNIETIIGGDKRINEVVRLMQDTTPDGRLVVLHKARDIAKEHPRDVSGNRAA